MSFGVIPEMISAECAGLVFSTTTQPTKVQIEAWITAQTNIISDELGALGVDVASITSTSGGYSIIQRYIVAFVASQARMSRERTDDALAQALRREADGLYKRMISRMASLGTSQPTSDTDPQITWQRRDSDPTRTGTSAAVGYFGRTDGQI